MASHNFSEEARTLVYNTDGTLNYVEITLNSNTYRQTYTYNASGQMTGVSKWIKQ